MTTRYSPSPWRYAVSPTCPDVWEILADFCESPIAEVPRWQDDEGTDSPEAMANVAILAAAPRMYETLAFVADMLSSMKPDFRRQIGLDAALAEALAALKRPTGSMRRPPMPEPDDLFSDLFHRSALAAFLEQAAAERGWPDSEATRRRAYQLYEAALAKR